MLTGKLRSDGCARFGELMCFDSGPITVYPTQRIPGLHEALWSIGISSTNGWMIHYAPLSGKFHVHHNHLCCGAGVQSFPSFRVGKRYYDAEALRNRAGVQLGVEWIEQKPVIPMEQQHWVLVVSTDDAATAERMNGKYVAKRGAKSVLVYNGGRWQQPFFDVAFPLQAGPSIFATGIYSGCEPQSVDLYLLRGFSGRKDHLTLTRSALHTSFYTLGLKVAQPTSGRGP